MTQYPNRTAREKHTVTCPECAAQGPLGSSAAKGVESEPPMPAPVSDGPSLDLECAGPRSVPRSGTRVWLGAALLGSLLLGGGVSLVGYIVLDILWRMSVRNYKTRKRNRRNSAL